MKRLFQFMWRFAVRFVLPRAIRFRGSPKVRLVPGSMKYALARDANGATYPTSAAFFTRDDGVVIGKLTFAIHSDIFQKEFSGGLGDMDELRARALGAEMAIDVYKKSHPAPSAEFTAEELSNLQEVAEAASRLIARRSQEVDGLDGEERELACRLDCLADSRAAKEGR